MKTRFIKSIVKTSAQKGATLPWQRGTRRSAVIAKRYAGEKLRKSA